MPEPTHIAAVALGSNLDSPAGDRTHNLLVAIDSLSALGTVLAVSLFYDTAPVGYLDQPRFLNAAAILETTLPPLELLRRLLAIEQEMGRDRSASIAKGPRIIDLDLLLYDDAILQTPSLTLPHPAMHERRFVLEPLAEIAPPTMLHPVAGLSIRELLGRLT